MKNSTSDALLVVVLSLSALLFYVWWGYSFYRGAVSLAL